MKNKIIPLSEKGFNKTKSTFLNDDGTFSIKLTFDFKEEDVKQSINKCLNEIRSTFPVKSKEFIQLIEIEDLFKKYFGDLIE